MRLCKKCGEIKELLLFEVDKRKKEGRTYRCLECAGKYKMIWQNNNKDKRVISRKKLYDKNRLKEFEYAKKYKAKRKAVDPVFKLVELIRTRIWHTLHKKNFKKNKRFKEYIGCTVEELVIHLECKFDANMNWSNHGSYWHLDHIIPLDSASTIEEVMKLNHYTNLQPLEAKENLRKSNKILAKLK